MPKAEPDKTAPHDRAPGDGHRRPGGLEWLIPLVPFLVYLLTLAPTIYGLDSAELTTGAWALGIVHSPGSPLYLLLGKLFSCLPVGDVGFRLNLMSAVAAALGVWFTYRILRLLTSNPVTSMLAAWLLGFSYYYWAWALAAELYALQVCILAGLLLLVLLWWRQRRAWQLVLLAFSFGLGMGNHLALSLMLPGFTWIVFAAEPKLLKRPGLLALSCLSGLLGACVYLYLPLRHLAHPAVDYVREYYPAVNLATWQGFWWMLSGKMFDSLFFEAPPARWPLEFGAYLEHLLRNFHLIGVGVGVFGLVSALRRQFRLHAGLLLMFLGHLAFFLTYGAHDREWMFTPTYFLWAVWFGVGLEALVAGAKPLARHFRLLPQMTAGILVGLLLLGNWRYVDLSHDDSARRKGEALLGALAQDAVFLGLWEEAPILEYLQVVEGTRPDVKVKNLIFMGYLQGGTFARQQLQAGRPVYTSVTNIAAVGGFECVPVNDLLDTGSCFVLHEIKASATQGAPVP